MRILYVLATLSLLLWLPAAAADISGKWAFSVDLDGGGHGDPMFTLEQKGAKLTGTYDGPLGTQKVNGTVTGATAEFGFSFEREGQTGKVTYKAKIEGAAKMSGTVSMETAAGPGAGKWTATRK